MPGIAKEHLLLTASPALARELFRIGVARVTIETSSYCNRRCDYCPNSRIDRISERNFLPDALFERILGDLAQIGYESDIVLHYFNEPLADPGICEKIERAAKACPKANIEIYSNGDYLDRDVLERLRQAGLKTLQLSIHLGNGVPWTDAAIISRLTELAARLGKPAQIESFVPGHAIAGHFPDKDIAIRIKHVDYFSHGCDRGGLLDNISTRPAAHLSCAVPLTEFYVAWNGLILPCCNFHPDAPEHKPYVIGHIGEFPDIFTAYAGSALADWRRSLAGPGPRQKPCDTCPAGITDPDMAKALKDAYDQAKM
jgi:hypothetical protein